MALKMRISLKESGKDRRLLIETSDGPISVALFPVSSNAVSVVIDAPRACGIARESLADSRERLNEAKRLSAQGYNAPASVGAR